MKRIVEAEMEVRTNSVKRAINKFFVKFADLDYWKEQFCKRRKK